MVTRSPRGSAHAVCGAAPCEEPDYLGQHRRQEARRGRLGARADRSIRF